MSTGSFIVLILETFSLHTSSSNSCAHAIYLFDGINSLVGCYKNQDGYDLTIELKCHSIPTLLMVFQKQIYLMKTITPLCGQYSICCHTHVLTRILNRKKVTHMLPIGLTTDFVEIVEIISKFKNMIL